MPTPTHHAPPPPPPRKKNPWKKENIKVYTFFRRTWIYNLFTLMSHLICHTMLCNWMFNTYNNYFHLCWYGEIRQNYLYRKSRNKHTTWQHFKQNNGLNLFFFYYFYHYYYYSGFLALKYKLKLNWIINEKCFKKMLRQHVLVFDRRNIISSIYNFLVFCCRFF